MRTSQQKVVATTLWYGLFILLAGCGEFSVDSASNAPTSVPPTANSESPTARHHDEQKVTPTLNCRLWTQYGQRLDLTQAPSATASAELSTSAPVDLNLKGEVADQTFEIKIRTHAFGAKTGDQASIVDLEFSSRLTYINEAGADATVDDTGRAKLIGNADGVIVEKAEPADENTTYFRRVVCSVVN